MASSPPVPLSADKLRWLCAFDRLDFETSDQVVDLEQPVGQARAMEAMGFALAMDRAGYNVFALGPEGTGRHTAVLRALEQRAARREKPSDWCYAYNFEQHRKPRALALPAGRGAGLQADMQRFADELLAALRSSFESDEYRTRRQVIEEELKERQEEAVEAVEKQARESGIALLRTPMGFAFAPLHEGSVVTPEVFSGYPQAERERIQQEIERLQKHLQEVLRNAPLWMKETRERIRELNDETAAFAVGHLVDALKETYHDLPEVLTYLEALRADVVRNVEAIIQAPQGQGQGRGQGQGQPGPDGVSAEAEDGFNVLRRYRVNLIVDNGALDHAPVIYEENPSYDRLLGRIEHRAEMGTLLTDFHLIRPGALHRANGGYLLVDARKLLTSPMAWEALKQSLHSGQVRLEPLGQALGLLSTVSLEPEPIALDVKVVLVGERTLYYLLTELDPEFPRLFKVAADFEDRVVRSDQTIESYAGLVATIARSERLRAIERDAVARALEFCARLAGDAERLSTQLEPLCDLLREADYWAGSQGRESITGADIEKAEDSRDRRSSRLQERLQEEVERGTIGIDTDGARVGQINGLSVIQIGGYMFGHPNRITARVRVGRGEVVDIEREVKLGGALHSKGVLILSGFLGARYAEGHPLSLSASLVFEQSYGGVDGDSASSAELYALLSAIAEVPISQSFAVTGSVDQHGRVQAIGGVNQKIEGFFDLCAARGLTGSQGVLIPATNVKHLMLHRRVIDAVAEGRFHVYPIETIDQGIALLSGLEAGERDDAGGFPPDSVNGRVEARLIELAQKRRAYGQRPGAQIDGRNDGQEEGPREDREEEG